MPAMEWDSLEGVWKKECATCRLTFKVVADKWHDAVKAMLKYFTDSSNSSGTYDTLSSACKSCKNDLRNSRTIGVHRDELLRSQNGKCGICEKVIIFNDKSDARVDHDHETKKVRKVLCVRCNNLMAAVDDTEWLQKAIAYRDSFRCE